jgi:hypothetical protein
MFKLSHISTAVLQPMTGYPDNVLFKYFQKEADKGSVVSWTHNHMLYHWLKNEVYGVHMIEPVCKICGAMADRNYAGYGHMWLQKNGKSKTFTVLCDAHAKGCREWDYYTGHKVKTPNTFQQSIF